MPQHFFLIQRNKMHRSSFYYRGINISKKFLCEKERHFFKYRFNLLRRKRFTKFCLSTIVLISLRFQG